MNIENAKKMLGLARTVGDVICLRGLHGIGKSEVVKSFCKENDFHYEELILSIKDPSDLLGMGVIETSDIGKITVFCKPDWIQNLINSAWPSKFFFDDLVFKDENFKKHCEVVLETSKDSKVKVSRDNFNNIYKDYYKILSDDLELVKKQNKVSCKKSKHSVLFCDEFNRALPDTRNASMQLILEKRLHNHYLPFVDGVQTQIVMAINGQPSDSDLDVAYDTQEMDAAQLDRTTMVDVECTVKGFLDYARKVKMNKAVIDFLSEFPDRLHFMPEDGDTHATPRSWEVVSRYLETIGDVDKNLKFNIIKGRLGKAVGTEFFSYLENYNKVVKIEDIIELIEEESKEISEMEELGAKVQNLLKDNEIPVVRVKELIVQMENIYNEDKTENNLFNLLVMMYSLDVELALTYCKEFDSRNSDGYAAIAKLDNTLNSFKLFKRLTQYQK